MTYNINKHHRHSIRLKGYDYSQAGLYFITICVKNRLHLFGKIVDSQMILNDAGVMVEKWYNQLENKYPDIECGEFAVMPNHFHCIIINNGNVWPVAADPHVCPNNIIENNVIFNNIIEKRDMVERGEYIFDINDKNIFDKNDKNIFDIHNKNITGVDGDDILGEHIGSPLHRVLQWFKTMSTNEYIRGVKNHGWPRFNEKLWQRNYWEHIIRNDKSHQRISNYIINNPKHWKNDRFGDN